MKWRWIQLNVALIRHDDKALPSARALFAQLEPLVESWRKEERLRRFFFMRKPPDVRLRFLTTAKAELTNQLHQCALALQGEAVIDRFFFSQYKPETSRFGGSEAMNSVHSYFDTDTSMWMELDQMDQKGSRVLPPEVLVPGVLHDLFARALPNEALVLEAWRRLGELIPVTSETLIPELKSLAQRGLDIFSVRPEEGVRVLRCYTEANELLARSLTDLALARALTCELTDVLTAVGVFTFHRHGIGPTSSILIEGMIRALERERKTLQRSRGPASC